MVASLCGAVSFACAAPAKNAVLASSIAPSFVLIFSLSRLKARLSRRHPRVPLTADNGLLRTVIVCHDTLRVDKKSAVRSAACFENGKAQNIGRTR
ncbi:hypothetical protein QCE42_21575 [Caballeronia sp. LZ050]|nr:hypothetical protein [Caballeronia sp. LZ050]